MPAWVLQYSASSAELTGKESDTAASTSTSGGGACFDNDGQHHSESNALCFGIDSVGSSAASSEVFSSLASLLAEEELQEQSAAQIGIEQQARVKRKQFFKRTAFLPVL